MKKFLFAALLLVALSVTNNAKAQKDWRMGISVMPGVATNGGYGFALGSDVRFQKGIGNNLSFILTTGVTGFFKKDPVVGMSYVPVKTGLKYFFDKNFYGGGEVGLGFGMVKGSGRSFIWAPTIGLSFKKVDISVKYEDASDFKFVKDYTNNNYCKQFALRIAYGFTLE